MSSFDPRDSAAFSFKWPLNSFLAPIAHQEYAYPTAQTSEPSVTLAEDVCVKLQTENRASPSTICNSSLGFSPLRHNLARCLLRYSNGPPSGRLLRSSGRGIHTNSVSKLSLVTRTTEYPCPPISAKETCGDKSGFDNARALEMSPLFAYSKHDFTPCRRSILTVGCGQSSKAAEVLPIDRPRHAQVPAK